MKRFLLLIALLLIAPASYSEAVFNTSDKDSFQSMKKALSPEKGKILVEAFNRILERTAGVITISMVQSGNVNQDEVTALVMKSIGDQLNGATANEIIGKSKELLDQEITSIEIAATEFVFAEKKINSIKLDNISYKINKDDPDRILVPIDLTVTNNSKQAISTIYLNCRFTTPDRKTAWYEREAKHSIPGGIEPGETLSIQIIPNYFSWDKTEEIPVGAILSATAYRADDAHKLELWKVDGEVQKQLSKLDSLRALSLSYSEAIKE